MHKKVKKNPDFSYINEKGHKVTGAAATLHEIYTVQGGLKNYNDNIGIEYITEFVHEQSDIIQAGLEKKHRRNQFKVVNK